MPRRGVRNEPSPASFVEKRHAHALQLEKDLQSNAPDSSAANKIRVPLCACLSDVLLTDPDFSRQHAVVDRLWRHCFYSRIHFLRSQLMKLIRKKLPTDKVQKTLTEFLTESVRLYDYLIDELQAKLLGIKKEDSSMPVSASESTTGIVECMLRLYVQLGDLHRYSENFKKAEVSYQRAALLGPGHGHAMNQLAVVLSSKDAAGQRAVALYWYARSLSVTTAPFATARSNLSRLHDSNNQWLAEQPDSVPTADNSSTNKSMLSRRFLAQYCQLQEVFFRGLTLDRVEAPDAECVQLMQECRLALRQLLQLQALGDGLLCKLVTIQAFSECFLDHDNATDENRQEVVQTTGVVARTFTLQLGTELANRYISHNSSLRLVLPLALLAEYVWTRPLQPSDRPEWKVVATAHDEAANEFWNSVVQVLNQLGSLGQQYAESGSDSTVQNTESATASLLTEYQHLRGFAPFDSFLPKIAEGGVLSDGEAIEVLKAATRSNGKAPSHQDAVSTTAHSNTNNADQNRLKLKHFLALGEKWRSSKSKTRFGGGEICWDGERYSFAGTKQVVTEEVVVDDTGDEDEMMKEAPAAATTPAPTEPIAVELVPQTPLAHYPVAQQSPLVYHQAPGGGPALLVPTALLQNAPMIVVMDSVVMETDHVNSNYSMKQPEVTVGAAVAEPEDRDDPIFSVMHSPVIDKVEVTPKKTVQPPPGFGSMQPRSVGPAAGFGGPGHFTAAQQFAAPQEQSSFYSLFGGNNELRTGNLFEDPYFSPHGNNLLYPLSTNSMSAFSAGNSHDIFSQHHDAMGMDGASLLDSGLLSSLLMDDPPKATSKNPFAMT